jgi:hypothetical protein
MHGNAGNTASKVMLTFHEAEWSSSRLVVNPSNAACVLGISHLSAFGICIKRMVEAGFERLIE